MSEENKNEEAKNEDIDYKKGWELYYWQSMGARGTPVRLMFALGGAEWIEGCKSKTELQDAKEIKGTNIKGYPNFAFPIIRHKPSGLIISQTPAICQFLGDVLGFSPKTTIGKAHASQVMLTAADVYLEIVMKVLKTDGFFNGR